MAGMIIRLLFCTLFATLVCSGCGLIYKQNIQQGNAIEQEDLDELYEGMNKRQVLFVLGTPSVMDPFDQDRWDYVQTFSRRGNDMVKRTVTLEFENDLLTDIVGRDDPFGATIDDTPGDANEIATFTKKTTSTSQTDSQADSQTDQQADSQLDSKADPHAASIEAAEEEALSTDPDIQAIEERTSEEREYRKDMELLDQTPDDSQPGPDIDG
jgi:outer membrane protein assembly factor BamE